MGELGEGGQKTQTSRNKMNQFWGTIYSRVTTVNNTGLYI